MAAEAAAAAAAARAPDPTFVRCSEQMFSKWRSDPASVGAAWDGFFRKFCTPPAESPAKPAAKPAPAADLSPAQRKAAAAAANARVARDLAMLVDHHMLLQHIVRSYQVRGHLVADLDPLGIPLRAADARARAPGRRPSIDSMAALPLRRARKGMPPERIFPHLAAKNMADLERPYRLPEATFVGGPDERALPLREVIQRLDEAYCRHIGVEYMYITSHDKLQWIRRQFEAPDARKLDSGVRRATLVRLVRTAGFEAFLARKWRSERRFGIEGCEMLVPAVQQLIDRASLDGVEMVVVGAPHRGRLNLLANVCKKPLRQLLVHFSGAEPTAHGSGDLKYHLGTVGSRRCRASGRDVTVCVLATSSHLESADPVVQGRTRAEQFKRADHAGDKVMSLMIHGDAAFCGEGVVYETFHLSHLPNFTTHGSVHIVINNQVGFTTDPRFSRSSPYCTDVARVVNAPIFHVNADDPDAVVHCCDVAVAYRMRYREDVVIDLVGYRRNGHNEADEPMFTQPLMYKIIRRKEPVLSMYTRQLVEDKLATREEVERQVLAYDAHCEEEFQLAQRETSFNWSEWLDSPWKDFFSSDPEAQLRVRPTGVREQLLSYMAERLTEPPPAELAFDVHPGVLALLAARRQLAAGRRADWPLAEMLAFGSLLREGVHVRLSGQDVERGVFSQRHHVLHHQSVDKVTYVPLQRLFPPGGQAPYHVCNSSLSEFGVLGFEAGYAMASPDWLVLWEAQFGDFCNNAQCIVDQFLASGESKWTRQCGLVLLCPHGLEGMGPEHSSGHVERFLQLSADDPDLRPDLRDPQSPLRQLRDTNWIVANCSTPANLFHVLRRQLALPFRKPLVLFTPKGGPMRNPEMVSSFDDFLEGTEFQRVIPDQGPARERPEGVRRHILCSGKIYYEFLAARRQRGLEPQIALTRLEQLCPFPYDALLPEILRYPRSELCWGQEEHKNFGPWHYVLPRLGALLADSERDSVTFIGRNPSPSPAAGSRPVHLREQERLIDEAMTLNPPAVLRSSRLTIVRSAVGAAATLASPWPAL